MKRCAHRSRERRAQSRGRRAVHRKPPRGKPVAETVGWLVDKITIIELKIFHMLEQSDRQDVTSEFREHCLQRVGVMREQRDDLSREVTKLIADMAGGRVIPKVYRQFKMYNDPQYTRPSQGR